MDKEIARILLEIEAVKLSINPTFTWASGIKSPIYCDNRKLMSFPKYRNIVRDAFIEEIKSLNPDIIAGTATAGIPHAAWIADKLNLPMIYVRSSSKDHGLKNQIEGNLRKGQKVILIEDLISTGGSSIDAANAIKDSGGEVLMVVAIFTYLLQKAELNFETSGFKYKTLTNFKTLIDQAVEKNYLSKDKKDIVLNWYKDPENWKI